MSKNLSTVSVRIDADIKRETEEILAEYGLTLENVICEMFRQIATEKKIPFEFSSRESDDLFDEELNSILSEGYQDVLDGKVTEMHEVFAKIREITKTENH